MRKGPTNALREAFIWILKEEGGVYRECKLLEVSSKKGLMNNNPLIILYILLW